jgi:hypothetical protein
VGTPQVNKPETAEDEDIVEVPLEPTVTTKDSKAEGIDARREKRLEDALESMPEAGQVDGVSLRAIVLVAGNMNKSTAKRSLEIMANDGRVALVEVAGKDFSRYRRVDRPVVAKVGPWVGETALAEEALR